MQKPKSFLYYLSYCEVTIGAADSFSACVLLMPATAPDLTSPDFDYSSLDAQTSTFVKQQTREIRVLARRTIKDIYELGQRLLWVKEKLLHGQFLDWIAAEFGWSERTAHRFMNVAVGINERLPGKSDKLADLDLDFSALYYSTAPSTPEAGWEELFSRALAGEKITYSKTEDIKKKYKPKTSKPKPTPEPTPELIPELTPEPELIPEAVSPPTPTPTRSTHFGAKKPEIIAIRPPAQAASAAAVNQVVTPQFSPLTRISRPTPPPPDPDEPGLWWRLGPHLLCCDEPNSVIFQRRLTQKVNLLLAFPPTPDWFPTIRAEAYHICYQYLPAGKNLDQLDETLESIILFHSNLKDLVVSCFLPSIDILYIINRSERRGLIAEPNQKLCNTIINQWKKDGFKVERLS